PELLKASKYQLGSLPQAISEPSSANYSTTPSNAISTLVLPSSI
ncbi:MAG: hypothetical protein EZS28_006877, partial [Streblomastix strix]